MLLGRLSVYAVLADMAPFPKRQAHDTLGRELMHPQMHYCTVRDAGSTGPDSPVPPRRSARSDAPRSVQQPLVLDRAFERGVQPLPEEPLGTHPRLPRHRDPLLWRKRDSRVVRMVDGVAVPGFWRGSSECGRRSRDWSVFRVGGHAPDPPRAASSRTRPQLLFSEEGADR